MGKESVVQALRISNYFPVVNLESTTLYSQGKIELTMEEWLELRRESAYWKAAYTHAIERETALKIKWEEAQAQIRDLKQRLWGKKSEKSSKKSESSKGYSLRPRGQQTGSKGHGRTARPELPVLEEVLDLDEAEKKCSLFHGDETTWKVFEPVDGKVGYRWYLWVTKSKSVVYYRMAQERSAEVPKEHFSKLSEEIIEAILVCDRYSAYKKLAKELTNILLAFCWAHVRRDFLEAARSYPDFHDWMFAWVERIGVLYHLNAKRLTHFDENKALQEQSLLFRQAHQCLSLKLTQMTESFEAYLQDKQLAPAKKKVLTSLKKHWAGLTVFRDHPEVPMDNNTAERAIRNPVCGRRNYYGSGSVWSAELAAKMFTILNTIELWGLNPRHYLHSFFTACAANGGEAPNDLLPFLPWKMDEARRAELTRPLPSSIQTMDSS